MGCARLRPQVVCHTLLCAPRVAGASGRAGAGAHAGSSGRGRGRGQAPRTRSTRGRSTHRHALHSPSPMATSFLTSLLEPLWQEPCSGGIVPMYGVVVPALAAAVGFMRPSVVFAAGTPPPAVRPIFTVGVIVVLSVPPMVFVAIVYRPLTECVHPVNIFLFFSMGAVTTELITGLRGSSWGPPGKEWVTSRGWIGREKHHCAGTIPEQGRARVGCRGVAGWVRSHRDPCTSARPGPNHTRLCRLLRRVTEQGIQVPAGL